MTESESVTSTTEAPGSTQGGLFSLDPGVMIWTWVVFAFVLIVLRKFAWKPLAQRVAEREKIMFEAVENARKTKEELNGISQKHQDMLQEVTEESRRIVREGRAAADRKAEEIVARAAREAEEAFERGREKLNQEQERLNREFRRNAVDLIVMTSKKIMEDDLSDDIHRNMVEKRLESI